MRIGIVPALEREYGGVYQYSLAMLAALQAATGLPDEFIVFHWAAHANTLLPLPPDRWRRVALEMPTTGDGLRHVAADVVGQGLPRDLWRAVKTINRRLDPLRPRADGARDLDTVRRDTARHQWLRRRQIDLMFYPYSTTESLAWGIPYVMAIHDLQHRLQPEFPEVSLDGEWERREYLFRNGARNAVLLLADSEVGKDDIVRFYGPHGVSADRVKVLPFLPATYLQTAVSADERLRVRALYRLPGRYLFYPAQFWPHKNHIRIVQALVYIQHEYGESVPIVFCGSRSGTLRDGQFSIVMATAAADGLSEQIHYLGYVASADIAALYAEATALVMPTFFGPTNIPILEAWACGCPVLTSDLRGLREQAGAAAVLVDPRSVESIADGIWRLWTQERLRASLIARGRHRLAQYGPTDFQRQLEEIVGEAKDYIAKGWRSGNSRAD